MLKKFLNIFLIFISLFQPLLALGQVVSFKSAAPSYEVGDSFSVSLSISTEGGSINTISGKIVAPQTLLRVVDVRYGNSILNLWVEKPSIDYSNNAISFTGGIPGGFNGQNGPILTFGLKALRDGTGVISIRDLKVLLNDGEGTEAQSVSKDISIKITKAILKPAPPVKEPVAEPAKPEPIIYVPPFDNAPPELFIPLVSSHESIENNAYFVSFSTTDKISGISYYLVREELFWPSVFGGTDWATSTSPYIVKNQILPVGIYVRAYDLDGNYFEARARKPMHPTVFWAIIVAILLFFILLIIVIVRRDRRKYKVLSEKITRKR